MGRFELPGGAPSARAPEAEHRGATGEGGERGALGGAEAGQSLVLTAFFVLFLAIAVLLTFNLGHRTREKVKLQAMADASAYSLAVAEARAFNFYAYTNRAIISHYVSVLSVHAHESYLTWYEHMLRSLWKNWTNISENFKYNEDCSNEVHIANTVAQMFLDGGPGSWKWMHDRWHLKHKEYCLQHLQGGAHSHYQSVGRLRDQQTRVHEAFERKWLPNDTWARQFATRVDPAIESPPLGDDLSLREYEDAVAPEISFATSGHADYDEVLAASRWDTFVTNRYYVESDYVRDYNKQACRLAQQVMYVYFQSTLTDGDERWFICNPASYQLDTITGAGQHPTEGDLEAVDAAVRKGITIEVFGTAKAWSRHGGPAVTNAVPTFLHGAGHGDSRGAAAEDHGEVVSALIHTHEHRHSDIEQCRRSSLESDVQRPGWNLATTSHQHHTHVYGDLSVNLYDFLKKPQIRVASTGNVFGHNPLGMYQGHMRFRLGTEAIPDLWNMPRTFSLLTRLPDSSDPGRRRPWDFDLNAQLPFDFKFTTTQSSGDGAGGARYRMAALASGLVYYHQPGSPQADPASSGGRAPPSFWNPFWRAKLHPLLPRDFARLASSHGEAKKVLDQLGSDAREAIANCVSPDCSETSGGPR